jgi:hypothetical protein
MSKFIIEKFKKFYFEYFDNKKYILDNNTNFTNYKMITFIIRNGLTRNVENNFEIICETINYFLNKWVDCEIIFCFTGWFFFYDNDNKNLSSNYQDKADNKILNIQNKFVDNIKLIYPSCNIINKIGIDLHELINIFNLTNFLYDETGTSSMFANTIFDYKTIWSTNIPSYEMFLSQKMLLNNIDKVIPLPKEYIYMMPNNSSYNIDKNGYLKILTSIRI